MSAPDWFEAPGPMPGILLLAAYKISSPPKPLIVSSPPRPHKILSLLSPLRVSFEALPRKFSKLVAPPVVRLSVVPFAIVLSSNAKVSTPAPPSSKARFRLDRFGVPFDPLTMTYIVSSPAPILMLSLFFTLALNMLSLLSPRVMLRLPV